MVSNLQTVKNLKGSNRKRETGRKAKDFYEVQGPGDLKKVMRAKEFNHLRVGEPGS